MTPDIIREPAGTVVVLPPETISHREVDHRVANSPADFVAPIPSGEESD